METTTEELKLLAQNLANPQGEKGKEIGEIMNATNIGMTLESIQALLIEDEEHILEIGHGNAGHVENILNKGQGIKYTGIDISTTMHNEAKRLNQEFENKADFVLLNLSIVKLNFLPLSKSLPPTKSLKLFLSNEQ